MRYPLKDVGGGQESSPKVGEVVEILVERHAGKRGLVTAIHTQGKVQVELAGGGGVLQPFRHWFAVEELRAGGSRSQAKRARAKRRERETRIEVRSVCRHLNLADLCGECARSFRIDFVDE